MMLELLWRYSINDGEYGGLVIATSEEEAYKKVNKKYGRNDFAVWKMSNDDYFDSENADVLEIYGY